MAKKKKFDIHALYPAGHHFDWESFETDSEHYEFSQDDIVYWNAMELEKYELETPMTPYEKRALRRWVASGHSAMEPPPSKYGCIYSSYPVPDFLEVYRTDKELDAATKGMSEEQRTAYLKEYIGHTDDESGEQKTHEPLHSQPLEEAEEKIRLLQRQLHYLWMYVAQEGDWEEADRFVKEHMEEPVPFEDRW